MYLNDPILNEMTHLKHSRFFPSARTHTPLIENTVLRKMLPQIVNVFRPY